MKLAVLALVAVDVPVDAGRDEAREAARGELADPAYQPVEPSWLDRAIGWVFARLGDLLDAAAGVAPGGLAGVLVLALLAALVVVVVRLRVGRLARSARMRPVLPAGSSRSADEHRRTAEQAAERGDLTEAIRERFRAVVRELEQRRVLGQSPGRTADEVALLAGQALPDCAAELRAAAAIFDDVVYGGHPATEDGYRLLSEVDSSVRSSRAIGAIR